MTDETIKAIRQDFLAGKSYKTLSAKYKISVPVLQELGRKENWYKKRRQMKSTPDTLPKKEPEGNGVRLRIAVDTIAEIIDKMAAEMKGSLENGDSGDIKQLKELTLAAKELAAVIRGLEENGEEDSAASISVVLEGDIEKWAK